ncbi:MAG: aspartate--tRNA ligase [Cytophagales bacterium]|nr:aspartate--tRNA ligase [Cytophagales bacterium]
MTTPWRSHSCGELRKEHIGKSVRLCGWVRGIRDKGGMIWIDLRDRYGYTQLALERSQTSAELLKKVEALGKEWVIQIHGKVIQREAPNPKLPTGEIEVQVQSLSHISRSKLPPFLIEDETDGGEELRMNYRYLDLRRPRLQQHLQLRHQVVQAFRSYLDKCNFLEIETPMLIRSTPEGARDFLVPSRLQKGSAYALPQSPQLLKQLLMVSGMDRYYQLARCFRDEDLRSDRQPEFTQLDAEMSFLRQEDILSLFEEATRHVFQVVKGISLPTFQRISYEDCCEKYGTDKPDLRMDLALHPFKELVTGRGFDLFDHAEGVLGMVIPGGATYTRKQIQKLEDLLSSKFEDKKRLIWVRFKEDGPRSSVDKFYPPEVLRSWGERVKLNTGDLLILAGGDPPQTRHMFSFLRQHILEEKYPLLSKDFAPLWVLDFPLFYESEGRLQSTHHPFTRPREEDIKTLSNPKRLKSQAYDLVINGIEIGGGSLRIHEHDVQREVLKILGFSAQEQKKHFGFFLRALEYGAPPHGGIALGIDRLCALLGGQRFIKDFIAFPKNTAGKDLSLESPDQIPQKTWETYGLHRPPSRSPHAKL